MVGIESVIALSMGLEAIISKALQITKQVESKTWKTMNKTEIQEMKDSMESLRNIQTLLKKYINWYHNFTELRVFLKKLTDFIDQNEDILTYSGKKSNLKAESDLSWRLINKLINEIDDLNINNINIIKRNVKYFNDKDKGTIENQTDEFNDEFNNLLKYAEMKKVDRAKELSKKLMKRARKIELLISNSIDAALS